MLSAPARYDLSKQDKVLHVKAAGRWTVETVSSVYDALERDYAAMRYETVRFDLTEVEVLDTAGAFLLTKAVRVNDVCKGWSLDDGTPGQQTLLHVAADAQMGEPGQVPQQWRDTLDRLGRATIRFWDELYATMAFLGEFFVMFVRVLVQPRRLRIKSIVSLMEEVGLDAAPIVAVLSFAIGAVIAYMGANLLGQLGFSGMRRSVLY
ncbi:MAG: ABC transporter permease [Pseudomonadota bacterium]